MDQYSGAEIKVSQLWEEAKSRMNAIDPGKPSFSPHPKVIFTLFSLELKYTVKLRFANHFFQRQ
jgi:hypothetical protein